MAAVTLYSAINICLRRMCQNDMKQHTYEIDSVILGVSFLVCDSNIRLTLQLIH
jgi:hypothetical protein